MYVRTGMGTVAVPTAIGDPNASPLWGNIAGNLQCPGDPGCPGYVAPGSASYIQSLQDELAALYSASTADSSAAVPAQVVPSGTPGGFSGLPWYAWGAGLFLVGLALIGGGRRR